MSNPQLEVRTHCPVCRSRDHDELARLSYDNHRFSNFIKLQYSRVGPGIDMNYLEGEDYVLRKCAACELIFQAYIPNDDMMEMLYETWIDPEITRINHLRQDKLEHFSRYANEICMLVEHIDAPIAELRFLDFGMGWAKWSLMAKAFGVESWGSELSEKRIENAEKLGISICTWDDIPGRDFHLINTEQVFEHIPSPLDTLKHLREGLSSNGLLKISVPGYINPLSKLDALDWKDGIAKGSKEDLNPVFPLEHINCYSYKTLETLADKAGMKIVKIPLLTQYKYGGSFVGAGVGDAVKKVMRPFYRNYMRRQNYVFLTAK
ncbi:MAG: class I SAM-dependent methyltransferase [Gammaproteobacteria bacterium]